MKKEDLEFHAYLIFHQIFRSHLLLLRFLKAFILPNFEYFQVILNLVSFFTFQCIMKFYLNLLILVLLKNFNFLHFVDIQLFYYYLKLSLWMESNMSCRNSKDLLISLQDFLNSTQYQIIQQTHLKFIQLNFKFLQVLKIQLNFKYQYQKYKNNNFNLFMNYFLKYLNTHFENPSTH